MNFEVGDRLKELRMLKGITLKELGKAVEFNYSNLSKIERGERKPNIDLLERLAHYFQVEISYFFRETGSANESEDFNSDLLLLFQDIKKKNISLEEIRILADALEKIKKKVPNLN
ncbi:helix-turn-helix domain-containing protein [Neobacillus cucumis]|uniref:HTH cro/C1-type domain-containing protein n=1 Tax=Neobacillus cucumis TaxID=1740721 RepID=A0A2N5HQM6_9BACI|nr:helix-turn-helix transcriptional regulator [Neobacillus cucumis]PLS07831.1 hypothetical protein CVD27_05125 [Neobacillus cucumis]